MPEPCICEALAELGLFANGSTSAFPSECEGSCSCQDDRFFAPACTILESEYIHRADIVAYAIFIVLNFFLLCAIAMEWGLIVFNMRKRQNETTPYASSSATYFSFIATALMMATEIFMLLYYSFRIHDSYVMEAEVGKVARLITIGIFGVGLAVTLSFVCLTWLEIMATAKAFERKTLAIPKTIIYVAIGFLGPIAMMTSVAVPLLSAGGNTTGARLVGIGNGIVTAGILIVLLGVITPRAIRIRSWISAQEPDPHSILGIALRKTNYVLAMSALIVFVLALVVMRIVVSVVTNDDPRYRVVLETISLAAQFAAIALSLSLVSRYVAGIKLGFCPCTIAITPTYVSNSMQTSLNSSSGSIESSSINHTPIPDSTQSTEFIRTALDSSTTSTVTISEPREDSPRLSTASQV